MEQCTTFHPRPKIGQQTFRQQDCRFIYERRFVYTKYSAARDNNIEKFRRSVKFESLLLLTTKLIEHRTKVSLERELSVHQFQRNELSGGRTFMILSSV